MKHFILLVIFYCSCFYSNAQQQFKWDSNGKGYYDVLNNKLVHNNLETSQNSVEYDPAVLRPAGLLSPLKIAGYQFSQGNHQVLVFTNTRKVWRYETKGDYYLVNKDAKTVKKIGVNLPEASLMFAKFSPDGKRIAYVSGNDLYSEEIASGKQTRLTQDGTRKLINGTFDWAYEEEFFCRDGFRWSTDSKHIAYWQIDARNTKDYLMINNTDSIYPRVVPVEYPTVGEKPSPFKIGVTSVEQPVTKWMNIPYDEKYGSYVPRMEWAANDKEIIVQHLDRKQQLSTIYLCDIKTGTTRQVIQEKDSAWIDILPLWDEDYAYGGWDWINGGKEFIWASEKDSWRHLYRVSRDGIIKLITKGEFDVLDISSIDEASGYIYYIRCSNNATQRYLYRSKLDGSGESERISSETQPGVHTYNISPGANYALHSFSNRYVETVIEMLSLKTNKAIFNSGTVEQAIKGTDHASETTRFIKVTTADGISMDGWMVLPIGFDSTKKYPVVFEVYSEPWDALVQDKYGAGVNSLYQGNMAADGYIYIKIDGRGTPAPKGRAWRKSVYRKIGVLNIRDQAMAAREILKWKFVDTARIAVWGWSGGGSTTLNLMFQYPEIYKTGIAIAAVGNQLTYDNIYQERYMGLPEENIKDYTNGSPITHASKLRGNLLYIHGTGDDNVHYNNAEMLMNELIKYNKQFQFMSYPNRTHNISEGVGTTLHLKTLYTNYLKKYCPPGGR